LNGVKKNVVDITLGCREKIITTLSLFECITFITFNETPELRCLFKLLNVFLSDRHDVTDQNPLAENYFHSLAIPEHFMFGAY
jgi:hypothetical protein